MNRFYFKRKDGEIDDRIEAESQDENESIVRLEDEVKVLANEMKVQERALQRLFLKLDASKIRYAKDVDDSTLKELRQIFKLNTAEYESYSDTLMVFLIKERMLALFQRISIEAPNFGSIKFRSDVANLVFVSGANLNETAKKFHLNPQTITRWWDER
jgi:hypothetical protein